MALRLSNEKYRLVDLTGHDGLFVVPCGDKTIYFFACRRGHIKQIYHDVMDLGDPFRIDIILRKTPSEKFYLDKKSDFWHDEFRKVLGVEVI